MASIAAQTLAQLVLDAHRLREESYGKEASMAAYEAGLAARAEQPDNIYAGLVNYNKFYGLSLIAACRAACKQMGDDYLDLERPVYLLVECAANDVQEWALEVIAREQA